MLDKTFIKKKMDALAGYIAKLERLIMLENEAIKKSELALPAIERYFQQAVDQMIDINTHLIKEGDFGTLDDLQSTFAMLGNFSVIDKIFAAKIAPIVGVRNMLVHRYEKLDTDIFLNNLRRNFSDFKTYLIQVDGYLNTHPVS